LEVVEIMQCSVIEGMDIFLKIVDSSSTFKIFPLKKRLGIIQLDDAFNGLM